MYTSERQNSKKTQRLPLTRKRAVTVKFHRDSIHALKWVIIHDVWTCILIAYYWKSANKIIPREMDNWKLKWPSMHV